MQQAAESGRMVKGRLVVAGRRVTRTKQHNGRQEYFRQAAGKNTASRRQVRTLEAEKGR